MAENDTIQCKNCGDINDVGNAVCANCMRPLTAYGGQIGQEENYTGKLASQVAALDERPPIVAAMTVLNLLFALAGPLWTVFHSWSSRTHVNEEGTNAIQAATGIVVPLFQTATLLPVAIALAVIAYFTWTQRPWAWTANAVVLGLIAVLAFLLHGVSLVTFFWVAVAGVFAYLWYRQPVKAWFALG